MTCVNNNSAVLPSNTHCDRYYAAATYHLALQASQRVKTAIATNLGYTTRRRRPLETWSCIFEYSHSAHLTKPRQSIWLTPAGRTSHTAARLKMSGFVCKPHWIQWARLSNHYMKRRRGVSYSNTPIIYTIVSYKSCKQPHYTHCRQPNPVNVRCGLFPRPVER